MDDEDLTLLDALRAELADYERQRQAFIGKPDVDPAYRAAVLKMWGYAIAAQRARIAQAEG
jgi:hypothetical protein